MEAGNRLSIGSDSTLPSYTQLGMAALLPHKELSYEKVPVNIDYAVGDTVKIISGPLESFVGVVQEISMEKEKVRVLVSMFGRETPVELEFSQNGKCKTKRAKLCRHIFHSNERNILE